MECYRLVSANAGLSWLVIWFTPIELIFFEAELAYSPITSMVGTAMIAAFSWILLSLLLLALSVVIPALVTIAKSVRFESLELPRFLLDRMRFEFYRRPKTYELGETVSPPGLRKGL